MARDSRHLILTTGGHNNPPTNKATMEKEIKTYNTYNNGNNSKINVHFTDGTQWTRTIAAYDATMAMREGLPYVRYLMQKYAAPQPRPERPRLTREEERLNQLIATSHIVPLSPDQQEEMAILEDRVNTMEQLEKVEVVHKTASMKLGTKVMIIRLVSMVRNKRADRVQILEMIGKAFKAELGYQTTNVILDEDTPKKIFINTTDESKLYPVLEKYCYACIEDEAKTKEVEERAKWWVSEFMKEWREGQPQSLNPESQLHVRIARLRQERGLTQTQLAEMIGIKQPSLARIESGKHTIRLDILERICEALGVSLNLE